MSICLADFSAVRKELDSLDEQIFGQTQKLRQLQLQDGETVTIAGDVWRQYAHEISSIGHLHSDIADREAASKVYLAILEETEQGKEAQKVRHVVTPACKSCIAGPVF